MSLYFNEKHSPCWPRQSKPSVKLLDYGTIERSKMTSISIHIIANQSSYHDDKSTLQCFTCVFCPQLIRNVRSCRRIESSSIIAHPVNSDFTHLGEIVKMLCQELDIYIIYMYIYMTLLIIDMDCLYQFNMGFIAPLFSFFSWKVWKKKVF